MTYSRLLTLMAALALGSAAAAVPLATGTSAGTNAGTSITNIADAVFDDPTGGNTPLTSTSNTVTTKVNAITGFDILYGDGSTDDVAYANAPANYTKPNILPGTTVYTTYRVVNNSNIDNYVVNIIANGSASNVRYYLDADRDGVPDDLNSPITSVTLTNGGYKDIVQAIPVPSSSGRGQQYVASPMGSNPGGSINGVSYSAYNETSNQNTPGVSPTSGDLQPTTVNAYIPAAVVGPNNYPDGNGTGTYADPTTPTTSIARQGDAQIATVGSGTTTVTFIDTIKNKGALTDNFTLTTVTAGVVFKTPSGAAITNTPVTENGVIYVTDSSGTPTVKNVPAGGTANYQTVVTYAASTTSLGVYVTIESTSDFDTSEEDGTNHVVLVPQVLFGDKTNTGPDATQNPNPSVAPGSTANLLMQVNNAGASSDTYSFTSTQVAFQVVDASGNITTQNVPVTYAADENCNGTTDAGETLPLTVASGDTACVIATVAVPSNALKGQTPTLTQTLLGTSTITAQDTNDTVNVTLTFPTTPSNKGVLISKFTAKAGVTAGSEIEPNTGLTNPANYTLGQTTVLPGSNISYRILAKNVYNTSVTKFFLRDTVPANTTLQSIGLTLNGAAVTSANTIYSTDNGTTWTRLTTAIAIKAAGTTYLVGMDADNNNIPDSLGPNSKLELDLVTKIN
ncbi:hypothetical protein [Deinococcus hopiensis]|uniref:Uncharacterized protein n=1 Tax=Deinococcus hopiensis KR-140 TaxID=695939 RepID=A0A1W1UWZ8_9DEIO|nr:hypothetical protein [Deinococcus hopiensis]SMB85612.1 hypothetical protein SAMN00790413_03473 [Deinococcus hopiensis KR-140]